MSDSEGRRNGTRRMQLKRAERTGGRFPDCRLSVDGSQHGADDRDRGAGVESRRLLTLATLLVMCAAIIRRGLIAGVSVMSSQAARMPLRR